MEKPDAFNKAVDQKHVLITGGAGFIGSKLAQYYLMLGKPIMVFDNLSKTGAEKNLKNLVSKYGKDIRVQIGDIRNENEIEKAVKNAESVFHFAAQTDLEYSIKNPIEDFEINASGTLNILNSIACLETPVPLVFSSSNKVYGTMEDIELETKENCYKPKNKELENFGINESNRLDFNTPFASSKAIAEQYVLDFARTFQLPATVFRISSIYGPNSFNEDNSWLSHLLNCAIKNKPISIYGNGKQVRDILFIDDLVEALILTQNNLESVTGQVFNIGGGPQNAISVIDVLEEVSKISNKKTKVCFETSKEGDLLYYVSDVKKFELATGWKPTTDVKTGLAKLHDWLNNQMEIESKSSIIKEDLI